MVSDIILALSTCTTDERKAFPNWSSLRLRNLHVQPIAHSSLRGNGYEPAFNVVWLFIWRLLCCSCCWVIRPGAGAGVVLYGWFELQRTVYTLSTLLSFSKKGIRSRSSESVISSNQDATGTCDNKYCVLTENFVNTKKNLHNTHRKSNVSS